MKNEQQSFVVYVKKSSCPDCQLFDKKINSYSYVSFTSDRKVVYVLDLEQESNSDLVANFIEENQLKEVPSVLKVKQNDSQLQDIQSIF